MKKTLLMRNQLEYLSRHYHTVFKHLNPKRIHNILFNEYEFRTKKERLKSLPFFIKVEPTALCQIHCVDCLWHSKNPVKKLPEVHTMTCEKFIQAIEPISDTLVAISLSLRGDSFLSKEIFDILDYCKKKNIGAVFPSNLSYKFSRDEIERIVGSGLDHLVVSIDGTTQDVYEIFRVGGNLEYVMNNSKMLIEAKRKMKSATPVLEWKFVVFEHNKHQVEEARKLSGAMGFDKFSTNLDFGERHKEEKKIQTVESAKAKGKGCFWLYRSTIVGCDGVVMPCCDERFNLGNIFDEGGFKEIWNNEKYRALRRDFLTGEKTSENSRFCVNCILYKLARVKNN